MVEQIQTLCRLPGPSGKEESVREAVRGFIAPYADEILEDGVGNLLVLKRGRRRTTAPVLVAAHMDEVGIIIRSIMPDGFLRFSFVGGIDQRVVIGKQVLIGENRIPGIIGLKPIHLTSKEERTRTPKVSDLYLDIGTETREEALKLVRPGDYGWFVPEPMILGGNLVCQKALDDRVGCGIMVTLLKENLPFDTWFAFTVQEEIGCRGAFGAAFRLRPAVTLLLEGTTAADAPPAEGAAVICRPGDGPVLPAYDGATAYDAELLAMLREAAEELQIPWQTKTKVAGGTDARAFQRAAGGCRVAAISAAIRYIHSPSSVGCTRDFVRMKQLVLRMLDKLEAEYAC